MAHHSLASCSIMMCGRAFFTVWPLTTIAGGSCSFHESRASLRNQLDSQRYKWSYPRSVIVLSFCSLYTSDLIEYLNISLVWTGATYKVVMILCMINESLAVSTNAVLNMQGCGGRSLSGLSRLSHRQGISSSCSSTVGRDVLQRSAKSFLNSRSCSPVRLAFVGTPYVDRPTLLLNENAPKSVAALMNASVTDSCNMPKGSP